MKKIFSTILFVLAGLSLAVVLFFGIRQFNFSPSLPSKGSGVPVRW